MHRQRHPELPRDHRQSTSRAQTPRTLRSESSLSTLLSTSVLPHFRSFRLAARQEFDLWAGVDWVDLPDPQPELVDQLDFLQFEDHHGEMTPVGWYTSNAPTLCMANSEAAHLDKVRYLYINPRPYGDESWSVPRDA